MAVFGKRKVATSVTRRLGVCAVAGVLVLVAPTSVATSPALAASSASDWPAYLNGGAHSSYNAAATSITTSNIATLKPVWNWNPPASPNTGSTALLASPTVSNGVIYIGAKDGYLFAIDESTHTTKWSAFLGLDLPTGTCGTDAQGILSTATVANNPTTGTSTVYENAPDGNVYALNAATGAVAWKALVYTPSKTVNDYYAWGSPLVANGKVYVGIASDCDNPLVPGGLVAFDQATGAKVAQWNSLPAGQVGGSIWSSPVVLANGDIVATTGNGLTSSGQPLYDNSIVRLDPNTLTLKDHWQIPPSQYSFDGDFGASPTLFSATIAGVATPMVGVCNKNGFYYAFPQANLAGGPTWRTQITIPYPGGAKECVAAAVWNGTTLIEGGGAATTINGTTYDGSVQALDPATGTPVWQTGLTGTILGSPAEDGGGVVTAPTYQSSTGTLGVYLLNATTGAVIGFVATPHSPLFGQAVFAGSDLLVGVGLKLGLTDYRITGGPPTTAGEFVALPPARIMDTRSALGHTGPVGEGQTIRLHVTGAGGLPASGVAAVVINVTATGPTKSSYVTVFPSDALPPAASNLNFSAAETISNLVTVKLGADGAAKFFNAAGSVDLVADVMGYYTDGTTIAASRFNSLAPARIMDSRSGLGQAGPVGEGQTIRLQVTGAGGVPASGVAAVVINLTATRPTKSSYVTVFPSDALPPTASNLNFSPGETIPNLVTVKLGADGAAKFFNAAGSVDLVADVVGWYSSPGSLTGSRFNPLTPARLLDTRFGIGHSGSVGAGQTISLQLSGAGGVPASGVSGVLMNTTVTNPTASSYVAVFPFGTALPSTSNLNFSAGQTIPNLVAATLGSGNVQVYNAQGSVDVIADVAGWFNDGTT